MRATNGIFRSRGGAKHAARKLRPTGLGSDRINLIVPGAAGKQPQRLPVRAAEQPSVCKVLGAVTGAAVGLADGFVLGAVVGAADPGIGSITAIGFVVGTILGLVGAAVGAAAGSALDNLITDGPTEDELLVYEGALRESRSVCLRFPMMRTRLSLSGTSWRKRVQKASTKVARNGGGACPARNKSTIRNEVSWREGATARRR